MVKVINGKDWKGEPCEMYLDENLFNNLSAVKKVVSSKDFDYVALVCGLPGLGKSNFAITCAKFCCEWFDESYICFTAEEFIKKTTECQERSAIMLDESFASLNSKISLTSDFLKIVNHLQIIRQKNLYIFLCLPNFFDLAKGIAIYRSSHLFVCYGERFGDRGDFAAFDRDKKKELYIEGLKYMNYKCVQPNFRGKFTKQQVINEESYRNNKITHLRIKDPIEKESKADIKVHKLCAYMNIVDEYTQIEIANIIDSTQQNVQKFVSKEKDFILEKYSERIAHKTSSAKEK
jgi:hypothetical protein